MKKSAFGEGGVASLQSDELLTQERWHPTKSSELFRLQANQSRRGIVGDEDWMMLAIRALPEEVSVVFEDAGSDVLRTVRLDMSEVMEEARDDAIQGGRQRVVLPERAVLDAVESHHQVLSEFRAALERVRV